MTPETLTYDLDVPRRPSIDDLGGGAKIQRAPGPNPATQITAPDVNQWAKQIAAFARVVPSVRVYVRFVAGAPTVDTVASLGTAVDVATFTATDNGAGDTSITWDATALPAPTMPAVAHLVGATPGEAAAEPITNGARVRTKAGGVATDLAFVLEVL